MLNNWKPIKTAPKRSGRFLAYAPPSDDSDWCKHNIGRYAVCYYSCSNTLCEDVTGFMFDSSVDGEQEEFKPTHWMPLPLEPKGAPNDK